MALAITDDLVAILYAGGSRLLGGSVIVPPEPPWYVAYSHIIRDTGIQCACGSTQEG